MAGTIFYDGQVYNYDENGNVMFPDGTTTTQLPPGAGWTITGAGEPGAPTVPNYVNPPVLDPTAGMIDTTGFNPVLDPTAGMIDTTGFNPVLDPTAGMIDTTTAPQINVPLIDLNSLPMLNPEAASPVNALEQMGPINPTPALQNLLTGTPNNPYLEQMHQAVINRSMVGYDDAVQQAAQQLAYDVLPAIRTGAVGAGQYGGTRQGLAEGLALGMTQQQLGRNARDLGQAAIDAGVNLYGQAYESAQDRMAQTAMQLEQSARDYADLQQSLAAKNLDATLQALGLNMQYDMAQQAANQALWRDLSLSNQALWRDLSLSNQDLWRDLSLSNQDLWQNINLANQGTWKDVSLANQDAWMQAQLANQAANLQAQGINVDTMLALNEQAMQQAFQDWQMQQGSINTIEDMMAFMNQYYDTLMNLYNYPAGYEQQILNWYAQLLQGAGSYGTTITDQQNNPGFFQTVGNIASFVTPFLLLPGI